MQLSELKLITASNLIRLRTEKGLTQAELGAMLNYSDKTISKWERGEAIPDAYVLTQLAEIFSCSVDSLLREPGAWTPPQPAVKAGKDISYSTDAITAISVIGVWTLFLAAFVALWISGKIVWKLFVVALPISLLVHLILNCCFGKTKHLQLMVSLFVLSLFVMIYLLFYSANLWQIFLIAILAEVLVALSFRVQPRRKKAANVPDTPENGKE